MADIRNRAFAAHGAGSTVVALFLALAPCVVAGAQPATTTPDLRPAGSETVPAPADLANLEALYRTLHANPELSLHEEKTAARIAHELGEAGFAVTEHVGGFGVVGVLANGPGPTVLVRTELDALPVAEATGLPYASAVKTKDDSGHEVSVMHACGHDVHMTVLVGTARALAAARAAWSGTLVMIAQPAEERGLGAKAMLDAGLFTRFPRPQYCLALHVSPTLPAGTVGVVSGYAFANVDSVDLVIRGVGGHGASPHKVKDPVVLAAEVVVALQTLVSREMDPTEPAVVTVGSIHGGATYNVIPDDVHLQITVRSYAPATRTALLAGIERIARGIAQAAGVPPDRMPLFHLAEGFTPSLYNDPVLAERLMRRWRAAIGAANVSSLKPEMIGEDFSLYGLAEPRVPICMFRLGSVAPERVAEAAQSGASLPSLHSSAYRPEPAPTIATGVRAMSEAVLELLESHARAAAGP